MSIDSTVLGGGFILSNLYPLGNDPISLIFFNWVKKQSALTWRASRWCADVGLRRWPWFVHCPWRRSVELGAFLVGKLVTQVVFSQMIRPKIWKGDQWSCHGSKEMGEISFLGAITAPLRSHELVGPNPSNLHTYPLESLEHDVRQQLTLPWISVVCREDLKAITQSARCFAFPGLAEIF